MQNPFAHFATPDAIFAGLAGQPEISRGVTGIFMPLMASVAGSGAATASRASTNKAEVFYAAIEGKARGPYSAAETLMLAHKGKIRASTLVWKPGCGGWKPLKRVVDFDVRVLLDAAHTCKRRERAAEELAQRRLGIVPVRLERQTVRSVGQRPRAMPPPLPFDAIFEVDDVNALPQLGEGSEVSSPFLWRATSAPSSRATDVVLAWHPPAVVFAAVLAAGLLTAAVLPWL